MFGFVATALTITSLCADVQAQAIPSNVTIDNVTVTSPAAGVWIITVTGKVTLGTNHMYNGFLVSFTDSNNNNVTPFVNLTPPSSGNTATYTASVGTSNIGNWHVRAAMSYYTPPNTPGVVDKGKNFTVP
jgi:hypothetical protein